MSKPQIRSQKGSCTCTHTHRSKSTLCKMFILTHNYKIHTGSWQFNGCGAISNIMIKRSQFIVLNFIKYVDLHQK